MRATTSNSSNFSIFSDRALTFKNPRMLQRELFVSVTKLSAFTPYFMFCAMATGDYIPNVDHSTLNTWHGRVIPASFLVPLLVMIAIAALAAMSPTFLGDMICLHTLVTLARNLQVASSYGTPCISRMATRRAAVLFRRPSAIRFQRISAPCDEGPLSGKLPACFGGLLPVGFDVLQPLCEVDPVELRLHDVY